MTPSQYPVPALWGQLGERLAGYFAAGARGLTGSELVLSSRDGEEFGRLRVDGPAGARFEAGDVRATVERLASSRYRMLAGGAEVLAETAGSADTPEVRCGDRVYEARLGGVRNTAVAHSPGGGARRRRVHQPELRGLLRCRRRGVSAPGRLSAVPYRRAPAPGLPHGSRGRCVEPLGEQRRRRLLRKERWCTKIGTTEDSRNRATRREVPHAEIPPAVTLLVVR
jgi:hypothetical protein